MKILIPTYLDRSQLQIKLLLQYIEETTVGCDIIASCLKASASVNRNYCLDHLEIGETAIMIDDDITDFYPGWVSDLTLPLTPNQPIPNAVMVSARLLKEDGTFGPTCSGCYDPYPQEISVRGAAKHCILPTAAIAFIHRGHRFDERFRGSGWEDNDWMAKYIADDPYAAFIQSNRCKLTHLNEMKEQHGINWHHNKDIFWSTWPNGIPFASFESTT